MSQSRTLTISDEKKVITLGETSVGKSSFIGHFIDRKFTYNYLPTLGFDFKVKKIEYNGKNIKLKIFDTAGQERFKSMSMTYIKQIDGILLIYDITNKDSFESVTKWIEDIRLNRGKDVPIVLCGNKCDLKNRVITEEMGKKKAEENGVSFMETSCKEGINIDEAFMELVKLIENNEDGNEENKNIKINKKSFKVKNLSKRSSICC